MLLSSSADLPNLILAFSVALFLGLVCLLRMQHRREAMRHARLGKCLRSYAASESEQAARQLETDSQLV